MKSDFLVSTTHFYPSFCLPKVPSRNSRISIKSSSSPGIRPDPWTLSDSNPEKPKPRYERPKNPLSDDNARRIIKKKAQYLSTLRRNQGSHAMTPKWIKRTPEQMVQYLEDDRNGQMYGKHVVAAIKTVRGLSQRREGADMRVVMGSFVTKLSFRDMCVVLKEQRGWRQVRDFFSWMKLQLSYRPSVVVYTIVLRLYGQVGKIKMAEETFLEMLEVGCEPDAVACGTMLCTYARWGRHNAMLTFYKAVQERRIILSTSVYNFMMSSLQKKSFHDKVIDLWLDMVEKGVQPTEFTYTLVVSSYAKQGFNEDALKAFGEMKSLGFVPEEVTYGSVIGLCVRAGDWDQAVRLYEDMRFQGIVPSNYTCASMLNLYYKTENYPKALALFADMERNKIPADEVIRGLIIRIYGKLGLFHDAQSLFEETERLNLLADEKTYLAMSQVHLNSGNVVKALDVIDMMKTRHIPLSRFAYIVMLQCYCKIQNVDSAEDAFQALSKTGLPDASSCNDMLNLYSRLNLGEKAKGFIKQIMADHEHFDIELYKTAMRVYCKEGMVAEAKELVEKMGRESWAKDSRFVQTLTEAIYMERNEQDKHDAVINVSRLDVSALGMLLNLRLKEGNLNKTEAILKLMFKTDLGPLAVNRVISGFVREGDVSKAEILADLIIRLGLRIEEETIANLIAVYGRQHKLKEAKRLYLAAVESKYPGKSVISSMIDAYVRCIWLEDAYELFMEATGKGCDPGAVTISILVNALTNRGKHREAEHISRTCLEKNMELDTVGYNTLIKAMLEAGKLQCASDIYEQMHNSGVPCSIQTYNTMISVYGRGQQFNKAFEVFSNACRSGLYLDEKIYTNMIMHYGKAGKISEALALFSVMQKKGIKPGTPSYNMVVKICATNRLHREVNELIQTMERKGHCTDSSTYLTLVQAYAESSQFEEAEKTITRMQEKGIPLSQAHFIALLSAFVKAGMMDEAERIYCKMSEAGISPDSACKRMILKGYISCGEAKKGIMFYEKMIRNSVEDDRFVSSVVQDLYKAVGMEQELH